MIATLLHDLGISTHSLTRRLTRLVQWVEIFRKHFNSQPHKEADGVMLTAIIAIGISTHSLTRRLTARAQAELSRMIFQLTASQGG